MHESSEAVAGKTNVLSILAQIMTGLGFVTMLIGAALVGVALIQEFQGEEEGFQIAEVLSGGYLLLAGLFLAGNGQLLNAIRSIAINMAAMNEK